MHIITPYYIHHLDSLALVESIAAFVPQRSQDRIILIVQQVFIIVEFIQLIQDRLVDSLSRLPSVLLGFQTWLCLLYTHISYLEPAKGNAD